MSEIELKQQSTKTRRKRRTHTAAFKAKVAYEALKGEKTLSELADEYDLYINQVHNWRKYLVENIDKVFVSKGADESDPGEEILALHIKIGQLTMENDALQKSRDS